MIAIDTNILVYSHRKDSKFHSAASMRLKEIAESGLDWCIPWPCLHEFLSIVTHPKVYQPPSPNKKAVDQIELWMESPTLRLIGEGPSYWSKFRPLALLDKIHGPVFHDARIGAICLENGVTVLLSADRDFSKIPGVRVENPLGEGPQKSTRLTP